MTDGWTADDASAMSAPPRQDLGEIEAGLGPWLAARLGVERVALGEWSYPVGAGGSNETVLLEARWSDGDGAHVRELALRFEQVDYCLYLDTDLEQQCRVLDVLHDAELVRVPAVLGFEPDRGLLGRRFAVMERLRGRVPQSVPLYMIRGWLHDAAPPQRERLWHSAMRELARIHVVDPGLVAFLAERDAGETGFDQQVDYWLRDYEWACAGRELPALQAIIDWLLAHRPSRRPTGLSWGDARIGNMMFADDFTVAGVMDWEQVSLGGGVQDLAWWLMFDRIHSTVIGVERLEGLGGRDETIALWEDLTGLRADDLHFYEAFAALKVTLTYVRKLALDDGAAPGSNANNNIFSRFASELIGLPPPADMPEAG
jgi:aminoglycoside phosphotransferase (APT) family kinase protein